MRISPIESLRRFGGTRLGGPLLVSGGVFVGFAALAWGSFQFVDAGSGLVAIRPPNGLVVGLFVLVPARLRPWVLLGLLPGELLADTIHGYPVWVALCFGVVDMVESGLAGVILLKIARRRPRGDRRRDFYALLVAALAAPFVSGFAGTAISLAHWGGALGSTFLTWWLGDATGILLVGALAVSLYHRGPTVSRIRRVSAVGEVALVVVITALVFGVMTLPLTYVVLAPLTAVALRHGLRAVAAACMCFALVATFLTALGRGPFTDFGSSTNRVVLLGGFIVVTAFIAFLIAATMAEQRHDRKMLVELATHDQLTGLPNRRLFVEELERAEARRTRIGQMAAVVYLDLDGFKEINDHLGHEGGDRLLVEVGSRLASWMREGDFVARIGGDEFAAILQPVTSFEGATAAARRLADLLEHSVNPADLAVKVSFGVALLTADNNRDMRDADADMYSRKNDRAARARV